MVLHTRQGAGLYRHLVIEFGVGIGGVSSGYG